MKYAALAMGLALSLTLVNGCSEEDAGPTVTTSTYRGSVYDPVLDAIFANIPGMTYDSSWYIYTIASDGGYEVGMTFGMPASVVEQGTWTLSNTTYTFTVSAGWRIVGAGTREPIPADSLPAPYAGSADGDDIAFANYVNIMDGRPLGPMTAYKQP